MSGVRALWATTLLGFERALVYRGNYLISVVCGLVPLLAQVLFWSALYGADWTNRSAPATGRIAGYDLRQMITYFALVYVMQWGVATTAVELQLRDDIKSGDLNFHLLRPYGYLGIRFVTAASGRLLTFALSFGAFLAVLVLFRAGLYPPVSAAQAACLVPAVALAYALAYVMSCLIGVMSFWTLEVATLSVLVRGVMIILSGAVFPLDYIGGAGGAVLRHLPFAYLVYFPAQLYLRPLQFGQVAGGFALAAAWLLALGLLLQLLWSKGLRRYSAFGG